VNRYYSQQPRRPQFDRAVSRPTLHPRRVVGGIRLNNRPPVGAPGAATTGAAGGLPPTHKPKDDPSSPQAPTTEPSGWTWASARWMRPVEQLAPGDQLAEGLEYARAGQTRSLDMRPGLISARVQGRMPQAYRASVRLPTFTPEQWEKVTAAMAAQAKYAAALLAGELPTNIEDMFAPAGLTLFPTDASDLSCSCECDVFTGRPHDFGPGDPTLNRSETPTVPRVAGMSPRVESDDERTPQPETSATNQARRPVPKHDEPPTRTSPRPSKTGQPWCKHICCLMYLVADRLGSNPMTVFMLRGLPEQDLLERLRQARALAGMQRTGAAAGGVPVYTAHVPGVMPAPPLEETAANFWTADEEGALDSLDMPIAPPEVSHPLLRRIGPSPFAGAKFPITGLLATCYDVISEAVIREAEGPKEPLA